MLKKKTRSSILIKKNTVEHSEEHTRDILTSILLHQAQLFFLSWPFGIGDLTDGAAAAGGRPKSKLCISELQKHTHRPNFIQF